MFRILYVVFVITNVKCVKDAQYYDFEVRFQSPVVQNSVVEIYNYDWWYIAASNWTSFNSRVLCRSLGYSDGKNFTFVSTGDAQSYYPNALSFNCKGTEPAIQYCQQYGQTLSKSIVQMSCTGMISGSGVRLVGGLTRKEGRPEVYHNGEWGTICINGMVLTDAAVLCRSVGWDTLLADYELSRLPEATGRIWIDNLRCDGSESDLSECLEISWGNINCSHADDIYLHCYSDNDIRLKSNVLYGELQLYSSGVWGSVCYSRYNSHDEVSDVACRSLGFRAPITEQYGSSIDVSSKTWFKCSGRESSLKECDKNWNSNCYHKLVVICMLPAIVLSKEQRRSLCEQRCEDGHCNNQDITCHCYSYSYGNWCEYYDDYDHYRNDDGKDATAGIVAGSVSVLVFLLIFIIGISVSRCQRKKDRARASATAVSFSAGNSTGSPGLHIQPFSQSAVAGAQSPVPGTETIVPSLDPPPYAP